MKAVPTRWEPGLHWQGIDLRVHRTVVGVWEQGAHAGEAAHVLVEAAIAAVRLGLLWAEAGDVKLLVINLSCLPIATNDSHPPALVTHCLLQSLHRLSNS